MPLARAIALVTALAVPVGAPVAERALGWLGAHVRYGRVSGALRFEFEVSHLELAVGGGVLRVGRLRARVAPFESSRVAVELDSPELCLPSMPKWPRLRWPLDAAAQVTVVVHDGRVTIAGAPPITGVEAELGARVSERGRAGELDVRKLHGRVETARGPLPWHVEATARWDRRRGTLFVDAPLALGRSRARVHATYGRGAVDAELTELEIAPADLHALAPGVEPQHPIVGRMTARGPLEAIAVAAAIEPGRGRVTLAGTFDARARRGRGRVTLDRVEPDFLPSATPMVLTGSAELDVTRARLAFTLRGDYLHRLIDPQLAALQPAGLPRDRQTARLGPGGSLSGSGGVERRGGLVGWFDVRVRDAGAGARSAFGRGAPATTLLIGGRRDRSGVLRVEVRSERGERAR